MKMNLIKSVLFVSVIFATASCSSSDSQKKVEGNETNTKSEVVASAKTTKHIKIPGSSLYIIPPAGFIDNKTTGQLTKEYSNFMRMQMFGDYTPQKYFDELKVQADKDFPGSWKEEKLTVDGHAASIYTYKTSAVIQYYLAFTDGYTDEMIIASFEETEMETGKEMYEALKTVIAEKN